jgi:hypothetical protein
MFKLDNSETYEWPVKFTTIDAKGRKQSHTITLTFRRVDRDEFIDIIRPPSDESELRSGAEVIESDLDYLLKFVVGWRDVEISGDAVFNRDNLRRLLNGVPSIHRLIADAFLESVNGGHQRKN